VSRDSWDPGQYERFRRERRQPGLDLIRLVQPRPGMRIVDLGCGTGELTGELHAATGAAETLGVDSSDAMLERARAHAGPGLRFERGDIAQFAAAQPLDLVFSNAALHWTPDHPRLLARLTDALASGGQLAIQVPANHDQPSHRVAANVASEEPFRTALAGKLRPNAILEPTEYATLLDRLGYAEQSVRLQVYGHHLESREGVVEWVKGTTLTAYEEALAPELFADFLERYRARLFEQLEDRRPFFFPFKRLLLWARR
jgi:trans-aconitate 2-methyltransferase